MRNEELRMRNEELKTFSSFPPFREGKRKEENVFGRMRNGE